MGAKERAHGKNYQTFVPVSKSYKHFGKVETHCCPQFALVKNVLRGELIDQGQLADIS